MTSASTAGRLDRSSGAVDGSLAVAAVDLGASSGRVMLGRVGPDHLELTELHRFRNGPVRLPDGLYWDILGLHQDVLIGLREALRRADDLAGLAIDTWAVDYGLLDSHGRLRGNPRHYRDERTAAVVDTVHVAVPPETLYQVNGLQFLPFNTLYQLAAEPELPPGGQLLLIPDLLGYWLTGMRATEETNASTTGLLDARTGRWSADLLDRLEWPAGLLADLVPPGSVLGPVTADVRGELGTDADLLVTTVGSHDTASAVLGVPASSPNFAYISCGTWGLVGVELESPVLTDASREANFTNERGIDGTVRYLKNVMGLWLLSESLRTWELHGTPVDLVEVLDDASRLAPGGPRFDPNDPVFSPPGDMPSRVQVACREMGERVPQTIPEVVRCVLDSLAAAFATAIQQVEELSKVPVDVIHLVGGGSQNGLLCQLVADAAGRPVLAGPVEATALGNLLVQARTHGALSGDRWALRDRLRAHVSLTSYPTRHARRR